MKKYLAALVVTFYSLIALQTAFAQNFKDSHISQGVCISIQSPFLGYRSTNTRTRGEVSIIQYFLIEKKLLFSQSTGFYGRLTVAAVKSYQRSKGIFPTGNVGPITKGFIHKETCGEALVTDVVSVPTNPTTSLLSITPITPILTPAPVATGSGGPVSTSAPAPTPISVPTPTPTPTPVPLLAPTLALTTQYNLYVSSSGSDSNPGTQSAPFQTILQASQVALPGTTIHVTPGTYVGGFRTTVSGTKSSRISYISDTKWGAKIVPSSDSSKEAMWDNRGSYIDIVGFDVDGTGGSSNWLNGISAFGSFNVIRNNHVHHIATNVLATNHGGSGIGTDAYYGGVNNDVIGNVVDHIGPTTGTFIQGIYVATSGNVSNNLVYSIQDSCLHAWHNAHHVNFINNTVFDCRNGAGIVVGGGDFYNGYSAGNDYSVVKNNIVYDSAYGIVEEGVTGIHNVYLNNLAYKSKNNNWSLKNGLSSTGDISADPQFVNYIRTGGGNYHLRNTSPAIDKGSSLNAPSDDIDGLLRPLGGGIDIGASESY